MTDDIVTRLRFPPDYGTFADAATMEEAADEIERLRAIKLTPDVSTMRDHIEDLLAERANLYDLIRKYRARCAANNHQPMTGVMCVECYKASRDVPS